MTPRPAASADLATWFDWFWTGLVPAWIARVQDGGRGVFTALDAAGRPVPSGAKLLLVQARSLYAFAEMARLGAPGPAEEAARAVLQILPRFQKPNGLYAAALAPDLAPGPSMLAHSYDQGFVILGLATAQSILPARDLAPLAEALWAAITAGLRDPGSGLLRADDSGQDQAPAQNPHMHLYEACLAAAIAWPGGDWAARAAGLRSLALARFMDPLSGSLAEWDPASHPRREPGHQAEWAWLLRREADLRADPAIADLARPLIAFLARHGTAATGPMAGALHEAVDPAGRLDGADHLLWPQTEAVKLLARDPGTLAQARALMLLIFRHYFTDAGTFVTAVDPAGVPRDSLCLTRLMYHILLAIGEGIRCGLWPGPRSLASEEERCARAF